LAWLPFYYGWVNVVLGALAMVATLPGRTHGLGLVSDELMIDLGLDESGLAQINLWSTILGGLFCLPIGWIIDRFGTRYTTALVLLSLAAVVHGMSVTTSVAVLFVLVTLTRGLGQSALSVLSIAMVGKWFKRRVSLAMAVYSILVGLLFIVAFRWVGGSVKMHHWRAAWDEIAWILVIGLIPLVLLFVRSTPESSGVTPDEDQTPTGELQVTGFTTAEALATPAFWVFALGSALFLLASSGISLFNVRILREHNLTYDDYIQAQSVSMLVGLVCQLLSGWLAWRWSIRRLMAIAMFLYGASLLTWPHVMTPLQLGIYAAMTGAAGAAVTVIFFAVWAQLYGRAHLGRIQGISQMMTVLASALGPLVFAWSKDYAGSYHMAFYAIAPLAFAFGLAAWYVPLPVKDLAPEPAVEVVPAS
jgi:MFS family permease